MYILAWVYQFSASHIIPYCIIMQDPKLSKTLDFVLDIQSGNQTGVWSYFSSGFSSGLHFKKLVCGLKQKAVKDKSRALPLVSTKCPLSPCRSTVFGNSSDPSYFAAVHYRIPWLIFPVSEPCKHPQSMEITTNYRPLLISNQKISLPTECNPSLQIPAGCHMWSFISQCIELENKLLGLV